MLVLTYVGGRMIKRIIYIFVITILYSVFAIADTSDQKWMTKVELKKTGMHCADDVTVLTVITQKYRWRLKRTQVILLYFILEML